MKKLALFVGALCFLISAVLAQEEEKATKHENVTWHRVVKIDYKPGQVWRASEIIKMYEAAGKEAGTPGPEKYWFSSGKYDLMVIWKLDGGPADLEWSRSENNIKWKNALIKLQGSEEKVKEIQEEYRSLISSTTSEICRKEL